MSGELILEGGGWKRTALALLGSVLLSGAVTMAVMSRVRMEGLALAAVAAVLTYVLFRALYPALSRWFPDRGVRTVSWSLTPRGLTLGEERIPLESIKMVHCWPNRDALGVAGKGWTVNIETTGKNHLLRSVADGEDAARSARALRALVAALGYGGQWPEEEEA